MNDSKWIKTYRIKKPAAAHKPPAVIGAARPRAADGAPGVVWTSIGKGEFIVRRRKNQPAHQCPFLAYEVIRTAAADLPDKGPGRKTAKNPPCRRLTGDACHELLVMGLAGLIVCNETIRHKTKKERTS